MNGAACLFGFLFAITIAITLPAKELLQTKGSNQLFEYDSIKRNSSRSHIPWNVTTWLQFVLNFATRFQWASVVFFYSNSSHLPMNLAPLIFKHFNSEGRFVNVHSTFRPLLPLSIINFDSRLSVVYFCDGPDVDFLNKVSELDLFDSYRTWLITKPEGAANSGRLEDILGSLKLGMDTNMVIGTMERKAGATATTTTTVSPPTTPSNERTRFRRQDEAGIQTRDKRELLSDLTLVVRLVQVYKAARSENETLNLYLGCWDVPNGLYKVKDLIREEYRWNLGGYKIHVGVKNSSQNLRTGSPTNVNRFALDVEADEGKNFMELLSCLTHGINASFELVKFQKLGWRNEEGGWTHLLGGVVDETVDFALETIDVNVDKAGDMAFTHAIVTTMNNIYFHRPSTGKMRDIFLAPFSPKLVACVFSTGFLLAVAMISITVVYYHIGQKYGESEVSPLTGRNFKSSLVSTRSKEEKKWKISDAILWSISVLCMQGGQWSPKSISGNLLLINGLLFALVIYNAFAAFITSVLSVTNIKIKDLKDLADSDFAFGYTLGNSDELFLRTVNNTLLRELYFKGLRENDGVSDPIAGMHRAAKGKYAFFVAARMARRALRTVVAHEKRCKFQELCLTATKNHASIPVTRKSSMKKIVNLKIISLMETGILRRFQKLILLTMPQCSEGTTFKSAGLADVYSAFFVLGAGWAASLIVLLLEILWRKRKTLKTRDHFQYDRDQRHKDLEFWLRSK